jgi:hypothetical protein
LATFLKLEIQEMQSELITQLLASLLRHALTGVGAYLVGHGIVTSGQWSGIVGGLVTIAVGLAWSYLSKTRMLEKIRIALALPAGTSMEALNWVAGGEPIPMPPEPPPS